MAGVYKTIQDRIEKWIEANNPETYKELMLNVHKIIHEEIFGNLDERLYGFNRNWQYYGTWRITLWVNEFHFGEEIGKRLNGLHIITHDEEKTGSLEDFEDDIYEQITDWADDYWNEESWKNGVEL